MDSKVDSYLSAQGFEPREAGRYCKAIEGCYELCVVPEEDDLLILVISQPNYQPIKASAMKAAGLDWKTQFLARCSALIQTLFLSGRDTCSHCGDPLHARAYQNKKKGATIKTYFCRSKGCGGPVQLRKPILN
jgi:hypothetical protein